jgi:hypothetical protein
MIMKSTVMVVRTKQLQSGLRIRYILCVTLFFTVALTLNACGGNGKTGTGTDQTAAGGSASGEGGSAYTPEQSAAYSNTLAPYLRKSHPGLYFSKSGGSVTVREGAVWITLPFAGKDSALETCNAVAAFAASSEAPFAVPNVKVEAGPEPGSGSTKASITAKGAAGGTCTTQ